MGLTNWRQYNTSKNDPLKINTTPNAEYQSSLEHGINYIEKILNENVARPGPGIRSAKLSNYSEHSDSELLTNYAAKEVNPEFYGTLNIRVNEETPPPAYPVELTDIEYMHKKLANALKIPKAFLGHDPANDDKIPKSKYTIYKNHNVDQENLLIGHKGHTFFDEGIVYAPYIPLQDTPVMESRTLDMGGSRKLRAQWTTEMTNDLAAYHGIDAEEELTAILSQEISDSVAIEMFNLSLPKGKRLTSKLLGLDIVSVQPMSAPLGDLFFYNPTIQKEIKITDIQDLRNEIEKGVRLLERWRDAQRGHDWEEYQRREEMLYHFKNILYELDGILLKLGRTS